MSDADMTKAMKYADDECSGFCVNATETHRRWINGNQPLGIKKLDVHKHPMVPKYNLYSPYVRHLHATSKVQLRAL